MMDPNSKIGSKKGSHSLQPSKKKKNQTIDNKLKGLLLIPLIQE